MPNHLNAYLIVRDSSPIFSVMNEEYKNNVLKLAADGANWVTYRDWMEFALDLRGWTGHLTSFVVTQAYTDTGDVGGVTPETRWRNNEAAVQ